MNNTKPFLKKSIAVLSCIFVFLFVSFSVFDRAEAAFLFADFKKINKNSLTANILVNSSNQQMNAVEGILKFSKDTLSVTSLSKDNSILDYWIKEPSFDNQKGEIYFQGVILGAGFGDSAGKILTVNFKVKKLGLANFSFISSSILAYDGLGTEILDKNYQNNLVISL